MEGEIQIIKLERKEELPKKHRKYILIWPGRLPLIKKLGMNYFLLAQKK